ncbi:conserved exported hypothetical protein [Frankia canadensis]|uniref:Peptidase inhibitor family I36 n=1 Tax=Frankia canadensis TaxID=1836972 RepID=A0A2I2KIX8_9ACTN|nr:peptidase inhibitor family I36 protein [Frankia canadensis]SNQ45610.1 conserved exported hypothetical protein [Frankia canadensis]SOU52900.1 conserved exported hypothetical protein [Frankia canadensis]
MTLRRGLAVAVSGAALVTLMASAQPADAAQSPSSAPLQNASAPRPAPVPGTASTTGNSGSRSGGGVGTRHLDGVCNQYSNGDGDLCVWSGANFTGTVKDFFYGTCGLVSPPPIGNVGSIWNYDRHLSARLFTAPNYIGSTAIIRPNTGGNLAPPFRDNISCFDWI